MKVESAQNPTAPVASTASSDTPPEVTGLEAATYWAPLEPLAAVGRRIVATLHTITGLLLPTPRRADFPTGQPVVVSFAGIPDIDPQAPKRDALFDLIDRCEPDSAPTADALNGDIAVAMQEAITADPQHLVAAYDISDRAMRNVVGVLRSLDAVPADGTADQRKKLTRRAAEPVAPVVVYPVEYAVMELRLQLAGLLMSNMVNQANHTHDEAFRAKLLEGMSAAAALFKQRELPDWVALCTNGLAMGHGEERMTRAIVQAASGSQPVAGVTQFFQGFVRQMAHVGTDSAAMNGFLQSATCDGLMLDAALRLHAAHGTKPIPFGCFSHGAIVLDELEKRLAQVETDSAAKRRAQRIVTVMNNPTAAADRIAALRVALDNDDALTGP